MNLHIQFTDGSNPWFRTNMTKDQLDAEIEKWSENYTINRRSNHGGSAFLTVTEKEVI